MTCFWPLPGKQKYWPLIPPASHLADATLLLPWGEKCSKKGWSSSSKTKWGSRWIKNSLEMWDWRPEKSWIQATKIGIWHTTRDSTNKIDDCDEAIKRADLTNTQKKNGQNGFPSKHLTLWNMGIGSLPCSVVLVWLVRIYPIYPKITQVQPNVANRCLL